MSFERLLKFFRNRFHLIISFSCLTFWLLLFLVWYDFNVYHVDFHIFHEAFKKVLSNPKELYDIDISGWGYYYLPSFACFFSFLGFFNLKLAACIFLITNYILSIIFILLFNRIMRLMNLKNKWNRLLFLLIVSNGWIIFDQYRTLQIKLLVSVIFLWIIWREIYYRKEEKERTISFFTLNYILFIFAIGMVPQLIFLFIIYLFHEIKISNLFNRDNILKYLIVISIFLIENLLFLIYPELIFDFLKGFTFNLDENSIRVLFLSDFQFSNQSILIIIRYVMLFMIFMIMLGLIINKKILIEWKFSLFCFSFLYLDIFRGYGMLQILLPFILFLLIPFVKQEKSIKQFVKENYIIMISIFSIIGMIFTSKDTQFFLRAFPLFNEFPLVILVYLRWSILTGFLAITLIILNLKYKTLSPFLEE
ncbi:MAG: hypothetical protein ACFFAQ_12535 [Promethearchaeota archaeon]